MIRATQTRFEKHPHVRKPGFFSAAALIVAASVSLCQSARALDIPWDGGPSGTGTAWRTASNWNPDGVPAAGDNAVFDSVGTVTICAIDMGAAAGTQQVGMVTMGAGRANALSIRNLTSSTTNGILLLNGVGGLVLSNSSTTASLTFTNGATGGKTLGLGLGVNGTVYTVNGVGTAGQIAIYSVISEVGGSHGITKIGPGILYLRGVNTYSGDTVVNAGNLEVDDVGTIGNGTGTLYLSGGNLLAGATRNGTESDQLPITTPIMVTTDAYIQNFAGTATTRYLALAGPLAGTGGTLKIANPTSAPGNIFVVRFFSPFTFNQPMIVGEAGYDLSSAFSVMELDNTNGTQTFGGNIDGVGSIRKLNPYSVGAPAGITIFSGNNTYSGGTLISAGALLANNAAGSALGSGAVTVTNLGTLGGNGTVTASTSISANGTIAPGATATSVGNLSISDLTLGAGANYDWQIAAATGTAGVNWDLITAGDWTDSGSSSNAITIKLDSLGAVPTGWSSGTARDWVIIQSGTANGFDATHFNLDTSAFLGTVQGVFALSVTSGSLHLTYTPATDLIINVPSGSVAQGGTSPTPYPILTGTVGIIKIGNGEVVITNSLNDYQGSTKIYAGTASLAVDALNGSGGFGTATTPVLLGNTLGNSNAAVNINTPGVTLGRSVTVQSGSSGTKTLSANITSGSAFFLGDVTLGDNATLAAAGSGTALFEGNFTGAGGLSIGGGTVLLSSANNYSGPTTLTGGTLLLNGKALGTNTVTIAGSTTFDNTSAASVTLNSCPMNWNADFSFTGTTNLNLGAGPVIMNATRTITVVSNTLTVGGTIAGTAGLLKLGAGTLSIGSPTNNTYTGGTTNTAGVLAINGTATFGDGTGTLLLNGGSILNTGTRSGLPIANPVLMTTGATVYGNSVATAPSTRILPFSGNWTVTGGTLRVGNVGLANNTFEFRLTSGQNMTWPILVGDTNFDTAGAISEVEFYDSNTNPVQTISGLITGTGSVRRGNLVSGAGGGSIFTGNNTFSGGTFLASGTIGIGLDSTPTSGVVTSGPLGTGTFEIDNDPAIFVFASGGARTIGNPLFLNGVTNAVLGGTNALTFTGNMDVGSVAKSLTVTNTAPVTFSGMMTNTAALIKAGPGKLIFTGDNSFRTNTTTVNAGTLLVNNPTGSGTGGGGVIVNSGGILGGTGSIAGPVTVNAGGTISAGASIGTLTINNDLSLAGNVLVEVNTSASPSNDLVVVTGALANSGIGTVTVNNLGPALAVGNKFQIFSGPVTGGGALTISGGGVNWTNLLAVDGSIQVIVGGGSPPPNFTGGTLTILPNGTVSLTATGSIGSTYKLWASTNVALTPVSSTWTLLQSGTVTASPFTLQDTAATNFARRFYTFTAP